MDGLMQFIKPELLILAPVLYFIGIAMKNAKNIPDRYIPLALGVCAVGLALLYVMATTVIKGYQDALMAAFVAITQGILCAGASVYAHQIWKQSGKDD